MSDVLDILVILDRSGSMISSKSDHEGGLKSFVEDQKKLDGDVRFTLVQFDDIDPCEIVYDRAPIADVKDIVLTPRGMTPLYDAIGRATAHLITQAPTTVVCLIITDGQENSSREWDKNRVAKQITELEPKGWSMLFLGANMAAMGEVQKVGIRMSAAMQYDENVQGATYGTYTATSANVAGMRATAAASPGGMRGMSAQARASSLNYTAQQRAAAGGTPFDPADVDPNLQPNGEGSDQTSVTSTVTTTNTTNEEQ